MVARPRSISRLPAESTAHMLDQAEALRLLVSLGVLLGAARVLGEFAVRARQPAVIGEILAGILLGPTVLGRIAPRAGGWLFPAEGQAALVLDGLGALALVLFLLVAGMEVDLSAALRRRRVALLAGATGMALPFALGWGLAAAVPSWLGYGADPPSPLFAPFFAVALSISALPVIARTLMDLHLYRSDLGMAVVAAAMLNDLVGWTVFAILVGSIGGPSGAGLPPVLGAGLTLGFSLLALTVARRGLDRALPWILAHTTWPAGILGTAVVSALLGAAVTELAGVHAIFGAFLVGVALGDSRHLRGHARATIASFVGSVFAPLFFAGIGLRLDFLAHLDLRACLVVLGAACAGKLVGCGLGARWAGLPAREAWAFGFAMNARGSMEIVLGLLALKSGLIGEATFVALVVMAVGTTLMSGPALRRLLQLREPRPWIDYAGARCFVPRLAARSRRDAIAELASTLPGNGGGDVLDRVWERERVTPTGLGSGVAIPHARIEGLRAPLVALGLSPAGIDFDAVDGAPAHVIVLLLTPLGDDARHLELLARIGRTLTDPVLRPALQEAQTFTELRAVLQMKEHEGSEPT